MCIGGSTRIGEEDLKCIAECKKVGLSKYATTKKCGLSMHTVIKYWDKVDELLSKSTSTAQASQTVLNKDSGGSSVKYVGTGISEVMRTLGSEYAELLKTVTEKTRWFNDALVEIGWLSTLYAFQYARLSPKEITKKVDEFRDPDKFVEFVNKYLTAMIQASTDATNTILNLEKELSKYRDALKVAGALIKGYKRYVKELNKYLEVARVIITKYGLTEEYSNILMQMSILESITSIPEITQKLEGKGGESSKSNSTS